MIYVDEVQFYPKAPKCSSYWCHMWGESIEELHELAKKIGCKREWFQESKTLQHYDLTPFMREKAIKSGAEPMSLRVWFKRKKNI